MLDIPLRWTASLVWYFEGASKCYTRLHQTTPATDSHWTGKRTETQTKLNQRQIRYPGTKPKFEEVIECGQCGTESPAWEPEAL